jgi:hypothetical protein
MRTAQVGQTGVSSSSSVTVAMLQWQWLWQWLLAIYTQYIVFKCGQGLHINKHAYAEQIE